MKILSLLLLLLGVFLVSCSSEPDQKIEAPIETEIKEDTKSHHVLKGHQDAIQRAKDMEEQVKKAAEEQKKLIDDLDG
jgi:thioredoxin-related protein